MSKPQRLSLKQMDQVDLVKHHYGRRVQWGRDSVLYRKSHPMSWKGVHGNYQNWYVDTSQIQPPDAESPYGGPEKLFFSEDVTVWLSRRRESLPYFFRNSDADELHHTSRGIMRYETDFGDITVGEGDFLVIPKGITYRVLLDGRQEILRVIYESVPEIFVVPAEMVEHIYGKGRPALASEKIRYPELTQGTQPKGEFEVRVKYGGPFSEFLGAISTIYYDHYPLDPEIIDGEMPVFKFGVADIEKLGTTPVAFIGAAYLDNKNNLAYTFHLSGGGGSGAPVHRDPDDDELRYPLSGPKMGHFVFTLQGVDHGAGRGHIKNERNRPPDSFDRGFSISAYTLKPLKSTPIAFRHAKPYMA